MDMSVAFVANLQASKRVKPGNRAFDRPTRFAEPAAMGRTDLCEQGRDATFVQGLPMWLGTVAPIALNDLRLVHGTPPFAPDVRNGLDQCIKLRNVMTIRAFQDDRERDALRVDDEVVLAAGLAPVRAIGAGFFPASMARTDELSTIERLKLISPRRRSSARSVSWIRCQTPAFCHATSRCQRAMPEPQPLSCGSRFHAMPERSTNTMPLSTARSGVGLCLAYWRLHGARAGRSGSMSDHSSSSTSSLGIASRQAKQDTKLTPDQES